MSEEFQSLNNGKVVEGAAAKADRLNRESLSQESPMGTITPHGLILSTVICR